MELSKNSLQDKMAYKQLVRGTKAKENKAKKQV
jgi:hypothetical protein